MNKPYSESCDQNREPIFDVIQPLLANKKHVLEVGSGAGQHAVYFAKKMPHLIWQTSDQIAYHAGIKQWLSDADLPNTPPPLKLDVSNDTWPNVNDDTQNLKQGYDVIFSANAVHIMSWQNVLDFINNAGKLLESKGLFILYGPFNYNNAYTSESNARFDVWLKNNNPESGIRNFETINELAEERSLRLINDYSMPANNRILAWVKQ